LCVERVEFGAKSLGRRARRLIGETLLGGALPEIDLHRPLTVWRALHGARAIDGVVLQRLGRFWRPGRIKHKAKDQSPQVEMQIILLLEQGCHFPFVPGRDQFRCRECFLKIGDDVVAFDVNSAIMH
jgi:hypothetical protein